MPLPGMAWISLGWLSGLFGDLARPRRQDQRHHRHEKVPWRAALRVRSCKVLRDLEFEPLRECRGETVAILALALKICLARVSVCPQIWGTNGTGFPMVSPCSQTDPEANQMQQLNCALEEVGHCLAQFHYRLLMEKEECFASGWG